MASMLYRQESEVANELKLALEEACLELGVSLSNAFSPSALWLFDANNGDPALADLASWVNITRRRSYRPSPLNKYRKYSLPSLDDAETSEKELEERVEDDKVEILSDGEGSDIQALPEMRLKERLSNAAELDVLAKDLDWSNLLSVHRTEHAQSEDDESSDGRDSIGSIEMTVNSGGVVYFAMFRKNHVESGNDDSEENENIKYEAAAVFKFGSSRLATQSERLGIEIARHLGVATPQARVIHNNSSEWMQIQDAVVAVRETDKANENVIGLQTCEELLEALHLSRCMLIMGYIRGKPLAESKQAFASEKVAVKTAIALGRTLVLDMVLRNEDRLVCHTLGWRGNSGNLLVTEEVPHGLDQLGPPVLDSKQISGGSGFTRQRRTQSLAALSTSSNTDILVQLPKMHRSPSPELSHAGTAQSHALQNLLVPEESEALASKMGELKMKDKKEEPSCLLVAIDSGVSRRPPGMKIEHDRRIYSKTIELLLHDEETAGNLLREISFWYLGPPFENEKTSEADFSGEPATPPEEFDHHKIIRAFQRGVIVGIRDMQVLRMFMVKLFRTLDQLLREFMAYVSNLPDEEGSKTETEVTKPPVEETQPSDVKVSPENGTPQKPSGSTSMMSSEQQESPQSLPSGPVSTPIREKSPRVSMLKISPSSLRKSPVSSPRLNSPNKISPVRESWHKKGSPGRMTFKLKDVSKTAKIDCEWSKKLEWWDEKMRSEGQKLCKDHKFTTGFLEGGGSHSVVDSYELKVRLEHILERMIMISNGSDTEKPSCVLSPSLYIGSALAARSVNTLQHLRITHVLCLCPSDLEDANVGDFPELFTYKHLEVKDVEDENIAAHFEEACSFIAQAEGDNKTILVHCFEGKSRSATMVLAYLMLRKGHTLAQAWSILKTAHRRTQPNDGFMKTLVELDKKLHGKASMTFLKRRPAGQRCPICDKVAGFSIVALQQHIRRVHPGIPLHSQSAPIV